MGSPESSTGARSTTSIIQGKSKDKPDHNYLRDALAALVSGGKIPVTATKVAGCLIDRVPVKPLDPSRTPKIRAAAPSVAAALDEQEKEHPVECRQGLLFRRGRHHHPEQVPDLPPPGSGRAVFAIDL